MSSQTASSCVPDSLVAWPVMTASQPVSEPKQPKPAKHRASMVCGTSLGLQLGLPWSANLSEKSRCPESQESRGSRALSSYQVSIPTRGSKPAIPPNSSQRPSLPSMGANFPIKMQAMRSSTGPGEVLPEPAKSLVTSGKKIYLRGVRATAVSSLPRAWGVVRRL